MLHPIKWRLIPVLTALVVLLPMLGLAARPPLASRSGPVKPALPELYAPQIKAQAWLLMDAVTGQVLAQHAAHSRRPPAALAKLMTSYVVFAELAAGKVHRNDPVIISQSARQPDGTATARLFKPGSTVPLQTLLRGLLIVPGNHAAIALAKHVAGSEKGFVVLMNAYAKRLGMRDTHYENASGDPQSGQYSSAYDTALLSRALIYNFPQEYSTFKLRTFTWNGMVQRSRNRLLWSDPSVDGLQTGQTGTEDYCLVASAQRSGQRRIAVVLGAASESARAEEATALLNYGFHFFNTHTLYGADQTLFSPRVWKGTVKHLAMGVASTLQVSVPRGRYRDLRVSVDIPATLIAPFHKGQKLGELQVRLAGKVLRQVPLVALQDVSEAGILGRLLDSVRLWRRGDGPAKSEHTP